MGKNALARSALWTGCMLFAHFVAATVLLVILLSVVPRFTRLFDDFDMELPMATQWAIRLSCLAAVYWHWLLLFGLGIDALILFSLSCLPSDMKWFATA